MIYTINNNVRDKIFLLMKSQQKIFIYGPYLSPVHQHFLAKKIQANLTFFIQFDSERKIKDAVYQETNFRRTLLL